MFRALTDAMAAQMAARPLGLSLQIEEADPVLNYKLNNYRDYLKARAEAALRRAPWSARRSTGSSWRRWAKPRTPALPAAAASPVLYQTRQHHAQDGDAILVPADVAEVQVGACLASCSAGRPRVSAAQALDYVAGYRVVADLSEPHASYFRPALKQQCRDGFCPIGRDLTPAASVANPDALDIEVLVDGQTAQRATTADLVRPVARLIADVTAFMSFEPGDILLAGVPAGAPRLRPASATRSASPASARWPTACRRPESFPIGPAMKHARIVLDGIVHAATEAGPAWCACRTASWPRPGPVAAAHRAAHHLHPGHQLRRPRQGTGLQPRRTAGLPEGRQHLVGHRARTFRPADVAFMHYECELAVVIGKTARNVRRDQAYDHVAGHRGQRLRLRDYLENWYRPNLRVKSRDTCTPLGPWLVDRDDIPTP